MLSSPPSPDHSPNEASASPPPPLNGASPHSHEAPEHDARASLALFEGDPRHDDDHASKNGEAPKTGALEVADDASIRDFYAQLVTLLTHENAPPLPKPPLRSSLRYALKRRALPALAISALAFVGLNYLLRPRQVVWTAQTELLLPSKPANSAGDPFAPSEASYDTAAQVALIGSEDITTKAMARVKPQLRLKGWGTKELFAPYVGVAPASVDGSGSLVSISVPSLDREASIELANKVILTYALDTQQRSTQNRNVNFKRTEARVKSVGAQLERARQDRANVKIRSGVGDPNAAQGSAAANIQALQNALDTARAEALTASTTDGTLAALQEQLRTAKGAYDEVNAKFFPDSQEARAAQAVVDRAQAAVVARQDQIAVQSANRIAQLQNSLGAARNKAQALPQIEKQQAQIEERITVLESAYRAATDRLNQLGIAAAAIAPTSQVLHPPDASSDSGSKKARALFVALLGALGLGLIAAMVLDRLDGTVRATPDPEALWNAPVLGALPASNEADAFFRATANNQKGSARAKTQNIEACYLAQSNILALAGNSGVRSILFSSALPGEDKATTAANLAVAMAYGGRETLLIDADFWNPTQHKNFGVSISPGYAQVLRDQLPLSEAIRPTTINNLYVLTPGQDANQGMGTIMTRLQGAPHVKNMNLLKKYFDVIVVDGPPATSLADAQLLAHLADAVVLVSSEDTPRSQVQRARSMLRLSGAFLLGVVLNRVRSSEIADWNLQFTPENGGK